MTEWLKCAIPSWWEAAIRDHGEMHHNAGMCTSKGKIRRYFATLHRKCVFREALSDRNLPLLYRNVHKHIEAGGERLTFTLRLLILAQLTYILCDSWHYCKGNGIIFLTDYATRSIHVQEGSYSQDCVKDNTGMSLSSSSVGHYSQQGHAN